MTATPSLIPATPAPRDLREGEAWTRAQTVKNALLYLLAVGTLGLLAPWPASWLRALGRALGRLLHLALPRTRRRVEGNLARALPQMSAEERGVMARDVYVELGDHLGDTVALLSPRHALTPLPIEPASRVVLDTAMAEGRGVVFVSAHLGPWERVAGSLVAAGIPLTTIAREGYDPRFTKLFDKLRRRLGVGAIYRGSPGAAVRIVRVLRRSGLLGAPMDLASRVPSIACPFLGVPARTAVGPARIALRTGAAVVVGTVEPGAEPGGLRITATRIDTADLGAGLDGERLLTTALNAELSRRILAYPRGWVWMHSRWTT
jgi:Kdo2-lipid IVA lauroyltransferase/acyltransferase